jgi:hypothetical protein
MDHRQAVNLLIWCGLRRTDEDIDQIAKLMVSGECAWHAVSLVRHTRCHCDSCDPPSRMQDPFPGRIPVHAVKLEGTGGKVVMAYQESRGYDPSVT